MTRGWREAAVARIAQVASDLPTLTPQLVFIGGSVLPLLVDIEERFEAPRTTKDVDAVSATATYTARGSVEEAIRDAGYRDVIGGPAGRFRSPTGEVFDLSFAGDHLGASGTAEDLLAVRTARWYDGEQRFRHASPEGFFLMKVAAFFDRGVGAAHASKDLADLAVLLVASGRLRDTSGSPSDVRDALVRAAERLSGTRELLTALTSHFRDRRPIRPDTPESLAQEALSTLTALKERA